MNSQQAINSLNQYCKHNIPCVFVIDYAMQNQHVWKLQEIPTDISIAFPSFTNSINCNTQKNITLHKNPIPFDAYSKSFDAIQNHLQNGNSFLVNLTAESQINCNLNLEEIYASSNAPYKLLWKNSFVVFSPEPFIQINENEIKTFPMKGTIDASIPNAEQQILNNKKEKAEHATIVDLLRNDLSMVAYNVEVEKYRYIETIKTNEHSLLQVSSCIKGTIKPEFENKYGSLLYKMLPAGSISGAPKPKTLQIINEAETHNRAFYTGIMGYFDGKNLETAVMIRYIEQRNNQLFFKSGGGITSQSNLNEEYNELIQKIYVPTY